MARVCGLDVCKIKCKKAYILKKVKPHHDHQKCAQEKERPENESPEEIKISRETTHKLRNSMFSRELSQNRAISEIYNHLPTREICYRHTETT